MLPSPVGAKQQGGTMGQSVDLEIREEVSKALTRRLPVVALESTIISHGMPYPDNVKTALAVEDAIRRLGACPATIAVIAGTFRVGLSASDIEYLGTHVSVLKMSRRDLPFAAVKKLDGATTVAATMFIASMAGIRVFATGGIGGVHRGAQQSFDISADLAELARTDVAVVCAGAKSVLDIGLTLEVLETAGVPTIGYGTDDFPAFYNRISGYKTDYHCDTPEEIARVMKAKWNMGLAGGIVVGNPVPQEFESDAESVREATEAALRESKALGISGKAVTPFLLAKIKELTEGGSLETNIALIKNNADLAARIAIAYAAEA